MTKLFSSFFILIAVFSSISTAQAQWWGSETLPGNPTYYTYRTRVGYWQYGALARNIATPPKFADRGIIRDWNDGTPIAVDRNLPGGRFAQQGVPNLVFAPRIDYFDNLGYFTDIQYRSGLRQYWPDDKQLLMHEWEQKTYEPEHWPSDTGQVAPTTISQASAIVPRQESRNRVQTFVVKQVPAKPVEKKPSYHERVIQGHAERRAAENERNRQYVQQLANQSGISPPTNFPSVVTPYELRPVPTDPRWFRDLAPLPQQSQRTATGSQVGYNPLGYGMTTYTIPVDPVAEREKQLEYALAQSPEISFFSPFQAKIENGTATITGLVGSEQQKQAAERILLAQPGVKNVQNLLAVAE